MIQNSQTKNAENFNHCDSQIFWDGVCCADDDDNMWVSLFYETFKNHDPALKDLESLFCDVLRCETAMDAAVNLIGLDHYGLIDVHVFTVIGNFLTKD